MPNRADCIPQQNPPRLFSFNGGFCAFISYLDSAIYQHLLYCNNTSLAALINWNYVSFKMVSVELVKL